MALNQETRIRRPTWRYLLVQRARSCAVKPAVAVSIPRLFSIFVLLAGDKSTVPGADL